MKTNKAYYKLFSNCILTKGAKHSILCDLQRGTILQVSSSLYSFLNNDIKNYSVAEIDTMYSENAEWPSLITELIRREFLFITDTPLSFPDIEVYSGFPEIISNAIIDFDIHSQHNFKRIIYELNELGCLGVELRFYFQINFDELTKLLDEFQGSCIRGVNIVIPFSDGYSQERLKSLINLCPRLKSVTVTGFDISQTEVMYYYFDCRVTLTHQYVRSENACGNISLDYMLPTLAVVSEAKKFNSCLNKKISIDKFGMISNCPSCTLKYGHHNDTSMKDIIVENRFKTLWAIKKDDISVCKDCEYRYVCIDCRAYISDSDDLFSKPKKCNYDPYEGEWL